MGNSQTLFRSGRLLHHSTGQNIWGPNGSSTSVPQQIALYNAAHGFSGSNAVSLAEQGWPVSPWDNEWERWHRIFMGEDPQANIQPILDANKIVVIKSCFPSSEMTGRGQASDTLAYTPKTIYNYKWHWREIITIMAERPQNFFVIWTNAPLVAASTNASEASLAKEFCKWAKDTLAMGLDPQFGAFPPNIYVFDYFSKLSDANGYEQAQYAVSSTDSHPNAAATALVAPQFVNEIFDAAILYEQGGPLLTVSPENQTVLAETEAIDYEVVSNTTWVASSDQPWCTVTPQASGSGTMTATFGENNDETRIVHITTAAAGAPPVIVTLTQESAGRKLNLNVLMEGLYAQNGIMNQAMDETAPKYGAGIADHITVELHNAGNYSDVVYSALSVPLNVNGSAVINVPATFSGNYYVTIKHRNSIETTTANPVSFNLPQINYSFNQPSKVYGSSLKLTDGHYMIYGGDINQDGIVDTGDFTFVDNGSANFSNGYLPEDINGDGTIDTADMTIVDNNAGGFVSKITP